MFVSETFERLSSFKAPSNKCLVTYSLNRETTTPSFKPVPEQVPSITFAMTVKDAPYDRTNDPTFPASSSNIFRYVNAASFQAEVVRRLSVHDLLIQLFF